MPALMRAAELSFKHGSLPWIVAIIIASVLSMWLAIISPKPLLLSALSEKTDRLLKQHNGIDMELTRLQNALVIFIFGTALLSFLFAGIWGIVGDSWGSVLGIRGYLDQSGYFYEQVPPPNVAETIVDIIALWWFLEVCIGCFLIGPIRLIMYQLIKSRRTRNNEVF